MSGGQLSGGKLSGDQLSGVNCRGVNCRPPVKLVIYQKSKIYLTKMGVARAWSKSKI